MLVSRRAFAVGVPLLLGACTHTGSLSTAGHSTDVDELARALLAAGHAPGFSFAVIDNGSVVLARAYGEAAPGAPARVGTLFNAASLAKPLTAQVALSLAARRAVDLDEPMSRYWLDPDIRDDPRAERLTLRLALSHQTGFPNWRDQTNGVLTFAHEPGEQFQYSGEGYQYAARFLERRTGQSFQELMRELVLAPGGITEIYNPLSAEALARAAGGRTLGGAWTAPERRSRWNAADDVYTSARAYARFMISVMNDEGLSPDLGRARLEYVHELGGACSGSGIESALCPLGVGMGLGWMVVRYPDRIISMHTGSDACERAVAFFDHDRRSGMVILANGAGGARLFPELARLFYPYPPFLAVLTAQSQ